MKLKSENQHNNASSLFLLCVTKTHLLSFLHVISISNFSQLGFQFSTFLFDRPLHNFSDVTQKFDNLQWWKIFFFSFPQTNQKILNIHILTFVFPLFCSYSPCQILNQIPIWDHNSEMRWGRGVVGECTRNKWLVRLF